MNWIILIELNIKVKSSIYNATVDKQELVQQQQFI